MRLLLALAVAWCAIAPASASEFGIRFPDACAVGTRLRIAAVGDLIFQPALQRELFRSRRRYLDIWASLVPILQSADIVYGNLEGPVTGELDPAAGIADPNSRRRGKPSRAPSNVQLIFNYHASLLDDLTHSGFKVLSTANNHALDQGPAGIDRTIGHLKQRGLAWTGTRPREETSRLWSTTVDAHGVRVAWLACTYGTNGRPDEQAQVLRCYEQREEVLGEVQRLGRDPAIHAVVVVPHWGLEDRTTVERRQRQLSADLIEAGALAVIGTHPHVLQAWEEIRTANGRVGLSIYSTGNFISDQQLPKQRLGMIALLDIVLQKGAGKAKIADVGYVATEIIGRQRIRVSAREKPQLVKGVPFGNLVRPKLPLRMPTRCPST